MRTISVRGILIVCFVTAFCVTGVSAQQMPWGPGGGQPGFVGMAPPPIGGGCSGAMCAPPPPPVKCRPPQPAPGFPDMGQGLPPFPGYNPYACPPPMCMPRTIAEPGVYIGYLFKENGGGIELQTNVGAVAGLTATRSDFDLRGVWLELALPVALSDCFGAFVTGAHLFPERTKALQSYRLVNGFGGREWNLDIQWWEINAGISCRLAPFLAAVGGFRWSSFVVDFNDPSDQVGLALGIDEAKLTTNAYIPFFGGEINVEPSCNTSLKAAFIGFPALPSDVKYRETITTPTIDGLAATASLSTDSTKNKSGYFMEALTEASLRMNQASLGAFAKFDWLHTVRTHDFTVNGANVETELKFDRRNWVIGGKASIAF